MAEWIGLDVEGVLNLPAEQTGSSPVEEARGLDRGVGQDSIRSGALERGKRLDHHPVIVQPIIRRRSLEHGVLATDVIGKGGQVEGLLHAA